MLSLFWETIKTAAQIHLTLTLTRSRKEDILSMFYRSANNRSLHFVKMTKVKLPLDAMLSLLSGENYWTRSGTERFGKSLPKNALIRDVIDLDTSKSKPKDTRLLMSIMLLSTLPMAMDPTKQPNSAGLIVTPWNGRKIRL